MDPQSERDGQNATDLPSMIIWMDHLDASGVECKHLARWLALPVRLAGEDLIVAVRAPGIVECNGVSVVRLAG